MHDASYVKVIILLVMTDVFCALQLGALSEQERETEALDSEVKLCQFGGILYKNMTVRKCVNFVMLLYTTLIQLQCACGCQVKGYCVCTWITFIVRLQRI